ncbi:MAG: hydrogenase iron-sulfur subunit, partial [Candidatus Sumerlaeota bacterium]|nr:hydrogenase iron-sulfur subunit [Candidatus Sumerlaeota bacterium]
DCHYLSGNYKARRRMVLMNSILNTLGLEPERLWFRWISASEGQKFADTITEMTESLKKLGPNRIKEFWNV